MEQIRDSVLACLDTHKEEDRLIKALNGIIDEQGLQVYPVIFNVLTNLMMEPADAEQSWREIITHYEKMNQQLE